MTRNNIYSIFNENDWFWKKYDGRKAFFKTLTREAWEAMKEKHISRMTGRGECSYEPMAKYKDIIAQNCSGTSYDKVIIEGNRHLYLASPVYRHQDYNKSIFGANTEANRKRAALINSMLKKHNG